MPGPMTVKAPGKVVLWGEYAVLAGAPAAVMAVNRYAEVKLTPTTAYTLFSSQGFLTPSVYKADDQFCHAPAAQIAETVLAYLGHNRYPDRFSLCSDTTPFFAEDGRKLGIGSSAALCTATYVALCRWLDVTADVPQAIEVHRQLQGGKGSGLDVAAAWHGGVIRYEQLKGSAWAWPERLYWSVIWTGVSATTVSALGNFQTWRRQAAQDANSNEPRVLDDLKSLCLILFDAPSVENMGDYVACLRAFDTAARLNIFTPEHQRLAKIATTHGLVYKPCGAGGGDIGLVCGEDPQAVAAFTDAARAEQFVPLDLEIASHGVRAS